MNESVWRQPLLFRPERFLERDYSAYEFVPFGGGNKKCLGFGFALFEMKLALFGLLSRKRLCLQSSARVTPAIQGITVGPRQAIRIRLTDY
jgi:cytochrome P450